MNFKDKSDLTCLMQLCGIFMVFVSKSFAKTVHGVLTSEDARRTRGQYVTTFCFYGEYPEIKYSLNSTGKSKVTLHFFLDDDWLEAKDTTDCHKKLQLARSTHVVTNTTGNASIAHFKQPRVWHIVYADSLTCTESQAEEQRNVLEFTLNLLNPDSLDNPTVHFSGDETGLFRFYQLLTLGYFLFACICAPRLYDALQKGGPMHLVIQLLSGATGLQAIGSLLMMLHLRSYSKDGIGSPFCELLSELFDVLSQFLMLYMLVCLSLGWTLAGTYRPTYLSSWTKLKDKPAAKIVAVLGLTQAALFIWEQYEERDHRMYHAHRSMAGLALVFLRILLAAFFASSLHSTVSLERSHLKKRFYATFTKCCMLWFLCYPALMVISWMFAEYFRYKFVTMTVVLCQCLAVTMLYRLFLSRSLYWEVSALSSTLPLRMDKSFGIKIYS